MGCSLPSRPLSFLIALCLNNLYFTWKEIKFVMWVIPRNVNVFEMAMKLQVCVETKIHFNVHKVHHFSLGWPDGSASQNHEHFIRDPN